MRRVFLIISLLCLLPFSMMAQTKFSGGGEKALESNYGYGLVSGQFVKFDPTASFEAPAPAGMQFDGYDFVSAEVVAYNSTTDHIYAYTSDGRFCLIDPQTNEISVLNSGLTPMTELAYDTYTKAMFGLRLGVMYSVNLADGTTTPINSMQTGGNNWVAFAINNDGEMYAILNTFSSTTSDLYRISTVDWNSQRIGKVPYRTEFAQSMAFNRDNGTLYWWQTSSAGNNFLQVNPNTAACTAIWPYNGYQVYGMFFKYAPKTYNITYATVENGTFSGPALAAENDEVTIAVVPAAGYRLGSLTWNGNEIDIEAGEPYVFTMPGVDVLVSGSFLLSLHNIIVIDPKDGTLATDPENEGIYGNTIQVLPTPDPGFGVQSITYTANNYSTTITSEPWQFTMPDYDVTVNAVYAQTGENMISIATDYYGYFDDIVTIAVDLTNDNYVAGTQMDIALGENLTFVEGSLALSDRAEAESWTIGGNILPGNVLRVTTYNAEKAYYAGNEGTIFTFQVKCARVVSINDLTITGLIVGTPDATGLEVGVSNGQLQIIDVEMNQPESQVVCNQATTAAVEFSSAIAESEGEITYAWTNDNTAIGLEAEGTGDIAAFTAINEGTEAVVANLTVTPTLMHNGNPCVGSTLEFTITVNPTGFVNAMDDIEVHNGDLIDEIVFTTPLEDGEVTYAWENDNPEIGLDASGEGNIPAFNAVNEAVSETVVANITVTPTYTNEEVSCVGEPISFTITVLPTHHYITVLDPKDGELATDPAEVGTWQETVTVLPTPDPGFGVGSITIAYNDEEVVLTEEPWEFVMPDYDVTVSAQYVQTGVNTLSIGTDYYGYFDDIVTVAVELTNDNYITATQMDIALGENLTYVEGSLALTDRAVGENWVVMGNVIGNNVLRVNTLTPDLAMFEGNEGAIFTFDVQCARVESINTLAISGVAASTPDATNLIIGSEDGQLEIKDVVMDQPENQVVCNGDNTAAIEFTTTIDPEEGPITYNWTNDNTTIGLVEAGEGNIDAFAAINAGDEMVVANLTVTPTLIHNGHPCVGSTKEFTITVNPTPVMVAVEPIVVCNGDEIAEIVFADNTTDGEVTYAWVNDNLEIGLEAEGEGNIAAFAATNIGDAAIVANISVVPTYTNNGISCVGEAMEFTITVNPTPVMVAVDPIVVCNGDEIAEIVFANNTTDGEVTYAWVNDNPEIGLDAEGEGNIAAFAATNTGDAAIMATISVVPTYTNNGISCVGEAVEFTITVNPTPVMEEVESQVVCNGTETAEIIFANNTTDGEVTYAWTNDNETIGLAAEGEGNIAAFVAVNEGGTFVVANLTVTPTYINNGIECVGEPFAFTITVNPTPVMEEVASQIVCNGEETAEIVFASNITDENVTYAWTNDNVEIGLAAEGEGNIAAFAAVNMTGTYMVANLTVTPTYTYEGVECVGEPIAFTITVNPTPVMEEVASQVVCNGAEVAAIEFASNITDENVTYAWTNDNETIGLAAAGEGNIDAFEAVNEGGTYVVANLTVTPTYTYEGVSCVGEPITFTITVNPTPVMEEVASQVVCNGAEVAAIEFASNITDENVTYAWTNDNETIGLAAAGEGNIDAFVAVNEGGTYVVANLTVTPTYTYEGVSCVGEPFEFTITVNPTPVMEEVESQVVCNGAEVAAIEFASNITDENVTYAWTNDNETIGLAAAGEGNIDAFVAVNEGNAAVVANLTVTPTYTYEGVECVGEPFEFTITVNPTPVMEAIADQVVCNGAETAEVIFASNVIDGTMNYLWTCDNAAIGCEPAGQDEFPAFTAVNEGTAAITATIEVTPYYTNAGVTCIGEPVSFTITVNPTPVMEAIADQVVCNGAETAEVIFASNVTDGTMNYLWTCDNAAIGCEAAGQDEFPSFTAVNEGTAAIVANFEVTPYYTNEGITCAGEPVSFTITVNPTPVMEAIADQVVCNGDEIAEIVFVSNVTDGTMNYLWTCDNAAIGCEAAGQDEFPAFTAVNAGNVAVVATIEVTPYYTNEGITCAGEPVSFTITVNPTPAMEAIADQVVCNGDEIVEIVFADNTTDGVVVYNWTNDNETIGLAAEGEGNIAAFAGLNAGNEAVVATIEVTPTYTNNGISCVGEPVSFTITVNPTPVMEAVEPIVVCNGAEVAEIVFADNTTDGEVVYNWTNNNTEIGLAEAGEGNIVAFNAINNGTAAIVATISVVPTYTNNGISCVGEAMEFTITVNPTPVMEAVANQVVCNGEMTAEVIFATNLTDGTVNYLWACDNAAIGCEAIGQDEFPAFAAVNEGNEAVTATITVLPVYTNSEISCVGEPVSFTITVNPAVVMDAVENMTVCDNSEVNVLFNTTITDGEMVYNWVNDNPAIGLVESGEGDITFVAANVNGEPAVANITVTPTYINNDITCEGEAMTFTVTVYPTAVMNEVADQTIYSREYTEDIIFTSNVSDGKVIFNWVNDNPAIGLAAEGTGNILSFMGAAPITSTQVAHITVTPAYNDNIVCTGNSVTFTITVEPTYLVVTAEPIVNGTLTDNARVAANGEHYAPAGELITLTATPAAGYFLENVTATKLTDNLVNVPVTDDQFFTMPEFDVEVNATFVDGDNLVVKPGIIDLGYRPINAWMYSKFFDVANISTEDFDITEMDLTDNSFFNLDEVELPYTIAAGTNAQFGINTNYKMTLPGLKNTTLAMIASHSRKVYTREVVGTAYTPVTPDVWELAANVTEFPYVSTQATKGVIYDNYQLPGETADGYDGVYKLVFDHDVILNAAVTAGNDPKTVLYDNGFRQVGGPHTNNYHDAPLDMDNVAIVGTGAITNSYAPYYVYYNYSLTQMLYTADELAAAGLMAGEINSIEYFTNSTYGYVRDNISIWVANVTNSTVGSNSIVTAGMPLVYTGSHTQVPGWNEFVFNGDSFAWDGTSNILVTFLMNHGSYNSPAIQWVGSNPGFAATSYYYRDGSPFSPDTDVYGMTTTNSFRPNTKFNGAPLQSEGVIADGSPIVDLGLFAGTYYLVASSTSDDSYTVEIDVEDIPLPLAPVAIYPAHASNGIETPVTFQFELGEYTHEYQLLLGTQYNNQPVVVDWTSNLTDIYNAGELLHNTIYYWRINERNSSGVTEGPLWVFTTELNAPENLTAEDYELYEGENAVLHWNTPADRTLIGYNIYQDGVKINDAPISETTYTVEGLAYNMDGYEFAVTAAYDEGESNYSNVITIEVSGYGFVSGHVYEQDGTTGIADATVTIIGFDEFGELVDFEFTTDENGAYAGDVLAGYFFGMAEKEGYQTAGDNYGIEIEYQDIINDYDFILNENYTPVARVVAEEIDANNVHVYWGWDLIEDFESGDLSAYEWVNDATYPWAVTTTDPYEGTYCIKSTNEGVSSSTSAISITMTAEQDGLISFFAKASSESGYDKGTFYIDGAAKPAMSGNTGWVEKEYPISAGTHTYTWAYTKDSSLNSNDDCFYVDYINFWHEAEPVPEGQLTFDFETGMQGWNAIDADGDGYNWGLISEFYSIEGHDSSDGVASQSYASGTGLSPDNYLVSPQLELGGSISFWANNYSSSYPEQVGIAISTTSGTDPNAFTTIWSTTVAAKGAGTGTREDGAKVGEWIQYTVDLSAYAGQTGYIALRHFGVYNMWALLIDDVAINPDRSSRSFQNYNVYRRDVMNDGAAQQLATGIVPMEYNDLTWGSAPAGVYQWGVSANYAGNRGESEIVWSNKIDKNMNAVVNVTVTTNSNDPVTGAVVTLTNTSEPNLGLVYTATLDETGTYSWTAIRKGEYDVTVTLDGYEPVEATETIWNATNNLTYVLNEIVANIEDLYVSTTGWAMFGAMPSTGGSDPWTEGFEGGLPEGWTIIDGNNDGWVWTTVADIPSTWTYYAGMSLDWYRSGANAICSGSYINGVGALNPDEYLITPQVTPGAGTTFSFWAAAADAGYPADHFGVFVSTTGTNPSDFVSVQEWTLTGKNGGMNGGRASRDGKGAKIGSWYNYSVDLSAYAGQNIYIAIRHFNCTDQYIMCVDDIAYGNEDRSVEYYNVKLDGVMEGTTTLPFYQHNVENLVEGQTYTTSVQKVYTTGSSEWANFDWVYTPCDNFAGLQSGPTAEWQGNNVVLNWVLPAGGDTPNPPTGETSFSCDFENGLTGWTVLTVLSDGGEWIHSNNNLGGYDYTEHAHSGTGFAMCYSFVDYVGSYNTDSYLITAQKYDIVNGSTLTFWADNANDSYPENFSVCIATADNPTAADFTQVWSGGAKGNGGEKATVRHNGNRYDNWRSHSIDLSAYAGQTVYIAFHDVNYDMYEIWIDDVALTAGNKGNRDITANFDDGTLGEWTSLDADNDGNGWYALNTSTIPGHNGSAGLATSASYLSVPLTPDNYLVSPQVALGGTLHFYACAQDASWAAEHFGVAVSTTVNNSASAFTTIQEWDMSAKGNGQPTDVTRSGNRAQGTWYEYTVDLSAYAGQTGYVAIRHFNCTDWFRLNVDDITLTTSSDPVDPVDPTPADNVIGVEIFRNNEWIAEVKAPATSYIDMEQEGAATYEVRVVYDGPRSEYLYYAMSCPEAVEVEDNPCLVTPQNLTGIYQYNGANDFGALIGWTYENGRVPVSFNVYRNGNVVGNVAYEGEGDYEYFDNVAAGNYDYQVTAVYSGCESDFAMTPDLSQNYVAVDVTSVAETVDSRLYPNPTTGNVTIEANGMTRITVISALGQILYDANVSGDQYHMNLGQYKAGVYMVRIYTVDGVSVKRVTVAK